MTGGTRVLQEDFKEDSVIFSYIHTPRRERPTNKLGFKDGKDKQCQVHYFTLNFNLGVKTCFAPKLNTYFGVIGSSEETG